MHVPNRPLDDAAHEQEEVLVRGEIPSPWPVLQVNGLLGPGALRAHGLGEPASPGEHLEEGPPLLGVQPQATETPSSDRQHPATHPPREAPDLGAECLVDRVHRDLCLSRGRTSAAHDASRGATR